MAIKIEKSNIVINKVMEKKDELVTIEGDCIVPDIKPDIIKIISTSGIVSVYKKEVSEGKIRIDGCVCVYVMYNGIEGESDSVRSINHALDFSQIIAIPEANSGMDYLGSVTLESIECKMINERKINIKANLNFEVKVGASTNIEYISNINLKDLQKKEKSININSLVGIANTKTSISEKMLLDGTDNLADILKVKTSIKNIDTKVSYNKVLIKADVNVKVLYSTDDGNFNVVNSTYPTMGFVDINDVSDENVINPTVEIRNLIIKPTGTQDHTVDVDIEIGMGVAVYGNKEISIIKDMYSPSKNVLFTHKKVSALQNVQVINSMMSFNKKELIDIGNEKIYDVDSTVIINNVKVLNNTIEVNGNMRFDFIHSLNKMKGLDSKIVEIPFEHRIPCDKIEQSSIIKIHTGLNNENINILPGGEIDIRMDIDFRATTSNVIELKLIENIEEDQTPDTNNYNLVIYYSKQNDDLWEIAKKFKTTQEIIKKENNLLQKPLTPGTQLFITKSSM